MSEGIPDLHYELLRVVSEDDLVAVHTLVTGTHTDTFFGQPASGRKIQINQMQFERIRDGLICEHWRVTEMDVMLRQLSGEEVIA